MRLFPVSSSRVVRSLLAGAFAVAAAASSASAQLNYTEGADLTSNLASPAPVGTLGVGINTVSGRLAATLDDADGTSFSGDDADSFSFVVPAGMVVSRIELVATNFNVPGTFLRVAFRTRSFSDGIGIEWVGGNTTISNLVTAPGGVLAAGTYNLQLHTGYIEAPVGSALSVNYSYRITVALANDGCAQAMFIGTGATAFDNTLATTDGPTHSGCGPMPAINGDLWYRYTATSTGVLTATTCGTLFDTKLAVYGGADCSSLATQLIGCNDDAFTAGCGNRSSALSIPTVAGQSYLIRVGGFEGARGAGVLNLSQTTTCLTPQVVSNPLSVVTCRGEAPQLQVAATGNGQLTYRWRRDGVFLNSTVNPSALTSVLTLANFADANVGTYDCVVSNNCGEVISATASVTLGRCGCLADLVGAGIDGMEPDGTVDGADFIAFINAFAAGC